MNPDSPRSGETSSGVNRRSFLVTLFGSVLGSYCLPELASEAAEPAAAAGEATRQIIMLPSKWLLGGGRFQLLWMEEAEEGRRIMEWSPTSPEGLAEAQRFYADAHGFGSKRPPRKVRTIEGERSPEEKALIRAILDNPEDDRPCLAYARWLDRLGDPQGECIRLHLQLKKLGKPHPRREHFYERRANLLAQFADQWLAPLVDMGFRRLWVGSQIQVLEPRGLIEELEIKNPSILPWWAEELFAAAPCLHRITFDYSPLDVAGTVARPEMAQVRSLALKSSDLDVADLQALVESPHLSGLWELSLCAVGTRIKGGRPPFVPEGVALLAGSELLARLHTLKLKACGLGAEGTRALFGASAPLKLRHLDLGWNDLDTEAMRVLASTPALKDLRSLDISWNRNLTPEGLEALAAAPFLGSLQHLNLKDCNLDPHYLPALARLARPGLKVELGLNPRLPDVPCS